MIDNNTENTIAMPYPLSESTLQPDEEGTEGFSIRRRVMVGVMAGAALLSACSSPNSHTGSDAHPISSGPSLETTTSPPLEPLPSSTETPSPERTFSPDTLFDSTRSWVQNFSTMSNGSVNKKDWNVLVGPAPANHEAQYYTNNPANLRIENGALILEARNQPEQGLAYTSARIDTQGKENFMYGKFNIRATIPEGAGTWPAIWMVSADNKYAPLSPPTDPNHYLNDGEIDIAESVGTEPHVIYGIAHALAYPTDGSNHDYFNTKTVPDNTKDFHDYGLEWTPTKMTFTIDGEPYYTMNKPKNADYTQWPFDQHYYLVVNLALGGSWGDEAKEQFPPDGVDKSILPAQMKIASIAYSPYVGPR